MAIIVKPFTHTNGTVADGTEVNSNNDTIYNDYNGNITNANVSASAAIALSKLDTNVMSLNTAQNVSAVKTMVSGGRIDCAAIVDSLLAPSGAPTLSRSLAVVGSPGVLQWHDGTAARNACSIDTAQNISAVKTITTGGQINGGSVANGYRVPSVDPSAQYGIGSSEDGILGLYGASSLFKLASSNRTACLVYNMRLSYSSGTFKVVGLDGNDLSSTNRGIVVAFNNSGTGFNVLEFTSSPSFQDDAHVSDSDFVGTGTMSWGTTAATAWGNDMPFLLGVCTDGSTPIMVIARGPVADTGASTNIGYIDNAPSSASQSNVFALTASDVTSSHANQKISWIGSFRMTKSASDDWTVTALDKHDGIMNFYNFGIRYFTHALGQMGATASRYWRPNGGTVPQFSTDEYFYSLDMNGIFTGRIYQTGDGGTNGASTVVAQITTPYSQYNFGSGRYGVGLIRVNWNNGANANACAAYVVSTNAYFTLEYNNGITGIVELKNDHFINGTREITGVVSFKAF